ncbi:MAG: Holliday junction resolvase RuvX [Ruminococcaceae bacterium]|nr:Holliday junction resolvase RuvX [Oscillospiraceae bacterium]
MILGIDFGDSRTGFASSDALGLIASTVETFKEKNMKKVALRAVHLAKELGAEKIVLGYPKNMNGTVGDRGKKSKRLANEIKSLMDIPVILWDERLTTVSAHNLMNETNVRGEKRKDSVDKIAAAFILQSYLDSQRNV